MRIWRVMEGNVTVEDVFWWEIDDLIDTLSGH